MGFKFRKSIKIGAARVNLSKSGVGYSVGGKSFRVTKKAGGGTRTTVGIPGTGITYSSDSGKKRHSSKNSAKHASESKSSAQGSSGCATVAGAIMILSIAAALMAKYWKVLLGVVILAALVLIAVKVIRHRKNAIADDESVEVSAEDPFADRMKQFEEELEAIPKVNIDLSAPAERQLLKHLPSYSFSNIIKKTRLDSIFPIVFLDVETTGFAPSKCEILEVSAIKFDSGMTPISAFTTLCKPRKPIPEEVSSVNHITDDMVVDAPSFGEVASALTEYLKGCHLAGHNLDFDLRFIFAYGAELPENVRFYDTLDLARLTVPQSYVYDYKLDTICHYYGIWRSESHRSLSDCYATAKMFSRLVFDKTSRQLDADAEILTESAAE